MARDRRRTLLIQHGVATIDSAESIGRHCWINQQVTTATTPPARRRCAIASGWGPV
jgi:serine acetyltransferase